MRAWKFVVLALLLIVPFVFSLPSHSPFWRAMNNSSHAVLFLSITVAVGALFRLPVGISRRPLLIWLAIAFSLLSIGAVIEIIQPYFGRQGSREDLYLDALGVAAGACGYWAWKLSSWRVVFLVASMGFIGLAFEKPARLLKWQWNLHQQLPLVCDFDRPCPGVGGSHSGRVQFVTNNKQDLWPDNNTGYAALHYSASSDPGIGFGLITSDWSVYQQMCVDVYWPYSKTAPLGVHIHDSRYVSKKIKFDQRSTLESGENTLCIDLSAVANVIPLDTGKIVIFYRPGSVPAERFYIDNLRLN